MKIAYVTLPGRGRIDDCIAAAVMHLERRGVRLCGTVATLHDDSDAHPCDRRVRILPDGPATRISQALGSGSRGCRLDPSSIENLAMDVEKRLADCHMLVINKFGKQESLGRGLRSAIVRAVDLRIPILVGVNALNLSAFLDFAAGAAIRLDAEPEVIAGWALSLLAPYEGVTG
ncbi:DUF2478 domain-containing protein [Albidovulum sediminis]|uniref:DUF2478 domain-containing protein n=1 Tax=Albidovulum sediminis TaxID=3066345 RepID=A0ABT2NRC8_9RHOB|nr:DUF2478 domain-containing protein [Defluviimonas sediminis]MCT8331481.1 DUF2478 domain-containing protein [Defluviimonas sediminis]